MSNMGQQFPQFYITAASPCPYLPDLMERKIFTQLTGLDAIELHESLGRSGFRRSQAVAYRPACQNCQACVSVRVLAQEFLLSKNMRRVMQKNSDLKRVEKPCTATQEQYMLLSQYLKSRHNDGTMANLSFAEYQEMVESSPIETQVIEYRTVLKDRLMAVSLTDILSDGISMVYSFFDPKEQSRGLGNYLILEHIQHTKLQNKPYVYLGYWVKNSPKMSYKARFQPIERLGPDGWFLMGKET